MIYTGSGWRAAEVLNSRRAHQVERRSAPARGGLSSPEVQALPAYGSAAGVAGGEDCRLLACVHPRAAGPDAPLWPGHASRAARAGHRRRMAARRSNGRSLWGWARFTGSVRAGAAGGRAAGNDTGSRRQPASQGVRLHDLRHSAAVAWLKPVFRWCRFRAGWATRNRRSRSTYTAIGCRRPPRTRCRSLWRGMWFVVAAPRQRLSCNVDNE